MAFNITAFRSGMAFDGQRPNLFEVTIPKGTGDIFDGDDLNLFAKYHCLFSAVCFPLKVLSEFLKKIPTRIFDKIEGNDGF